MGKTTLTYVILATFDVDLADLDDHGAVVDCIKDSMDTLCEMGDAKVVETRVSTRPTASTAPAIGSTTGTAMPKPDFTIIGALCEGDEEVAEAGQEA
jgi:hypothetical protein